MNNPIGKALLAVEATVFPNSPQAKALRRQSHDTTIPPSPQSSSVGADDENKPLPVPSER
jgi:hypothetical protein